MSPGPRSGLFLSEKLYDDRSGFQRWLARVTCCRGHLPQAHVHCGSPAPGASERAPQLRRRGEGAPQAAKALQSCIPLFIPPRPVEAAQSPTRLWTQRSRHFLETWESIAQGLLRGSLRQGVPHLGTHTWGACTWGPAPRGPAQGARHWDQGRAVFPSSHLMPARYLSSPSISLSSKNRKGMG